MTLPIGATAEIELPRMDGANLELDGASVVTEGPHAILSVAGGAHVAILRW